MQLLRLCVAAGRELSREHSWSVLRKVRTFTGVAAVIQAGEPPTAFDRFVPQTKLWNVNTKRALDGVKNQNDWLFLTLENVGPPVQYWSMQGGVINILPAPETTDSFTYSYISKNWIRPTGETTDANDKSTFTADTDEPLLSDELLILSGVWRWKQAKQLDYAEDMVTYERRKEKAIGDDRGPHEVVTAFTMGDYVASNHWPALINQ
jgi:hypothetical protein